MIGVVIGSKNAPSVESNVSESAPPVVPRGREWLFSGDDSYHVLADPVFGDTFGGLALGSTGSTLRDVLGRFCADGAPERVEF
jgi:hypothetical protein